MDNTVKGMMGRGADVDTTPQDGLTPLRQALLGLPRRRAVGATSHTTDTLNPEERVASLRGAGFHIPGDAVKVLDNGFRVNLERGPVSAALEWCCEHLCETEGDFDFKPYEGAPRFGDARFGRRVLATGKVCYQFGRGKDAGLKHAIERQVDIWETLGHMPKRDSVEYTHYKALRSLLGEIDRIERDLEEKDFTTEYVHMYFHTETSATELHGDGYLTFDDEDLAAARAVLADQDRMLEFFIYNAADGKGHWTVDLPVRCLGMTMGCLLATAMVMGGVKLLDAGICDLSLTDPNDPRHAKAPEIWARHIVNQGGAAAVGNRPGISMVFSGKISRKRKREDSE